MPDSPSATPVVLPIALEHEDSSHLPPAGELAHWHDAIEVVSATQGQLCCQTNQHVFTLGKGDLCFINRQQLHRLVGPRTPEEGGRGTTLVIYADALVSDQPLFDAYVRPVLNDPSFEHIRLPGHYKGAARIREQIEQMSRLLRDKPRAFELEAVARCYLILKELFCALEERERGSDPVSVNDELVKLMIAFIQRNYAENIQLEDIAGRVSVSKSTCTRLFKRYTGRSPVGYLIDYRLEQAATLLRTTEQPVAAIAQACGFGQQSYFSRMFQRSYGSTPRAYRKTG